MTTTAYKLLTPEQRAMILRRLKRGPKLGKRQNRLASYTQEIFRDVTSSPALRTQAHPNE